MTDSVANDASTDSSASAPEKCWYVMHAYSGMEKSVQRALQEHIEREGLQRLFGQILVPSEGVMESKSDHETVTKRRLFPGCVSVEMEMTDETWRLVKGISKMTGFIGGTGNHPSPISKSEVGKVMVQIQERVEKPHPKTPFEVGEMVRVEEGLSTDFNGDVEGVNYEKLHLCVSVAIFGHTTPVELEFGQVGKV